MNASPLSIPNNRAATGMDVILFQEHYNLSLLEMAFLLGSYHQRYQDLISSDEDQHKPIKNVSRALLLRILFELSNDNKPFHVPILKERSKESWPMMWPPAPDFMHIYHLYAPNHAFIQDSVMNFSLVLGASRNSGARWKRQRNKPHPVVERLMTYMWALHQRDGGQKATSAHFKRVNAEAKGRGFKSMRHFMEHGSWTLPQDMGKKPRGRKKNTSNAD